MVAAAVAWEVLCGEIWDSKYQRNADVPNEYLTYSDQLRAVKDDG
jgi:hypothetical protein